MKVLKLMIVMFILIMSVGAVCAAENITDDTIGDDSKEISETVQKDITTNDNILKTTQNDIYTASDDSFTNLTDEIQSKDTVDLTHDYKFNNESDDNNGILINKDNFVLNGNGHTIEANNQSRIFNITANNVTLSNLILTGGNAKEGGAIYSTGTLTLNNITFTNNYATEKGGAVALYENVTLNCDEIQFIDNYGGAGSSIYVDKGNLNLFNSYITSNIFSKRGQIVFKKSKINVENTTFINIVSSYTPALYVEEGQEAYIINSKFINLMANISAGALAVKGGCDVYIKDCEFINTTSSKNAGAILADIAGDSGLNGSVTVLDTIFKNAYSEFGGSYLQLGGKLLLNNTEFTNSHGKYNGGAVYLSYTESEINNCTFTSNGVELNDQGYPTYGGAIFSDISTLNIDKSRFINNTASAANAIYAYDTSYTIKNSLFENNTNPIYTFFDKDGVLDNNTYINDANISTNNELHTSIITGQGTQLTLLNNTINVTTIPESFDLRDYGWVTPVRDQGWMGACWTFGMTSALESALLKATGISADFSENNMQNTMIRYSIHGHPVLYEGGTNTVSSSYLLSWLGAFTQDADVYDELGKISPVITTMNDLHVQDVIFIPNNEIPNGTQLKSAIMKYGALDVSYFGQSTYNEENPYYNPDTYAQYVNVTTKSNHEVSVVGWDDNFPKERFLITPPGDGAWIIKNSWDTDWGDNGYLYVSYYDKSFTASSQILDYATAIIIENTEPYNKNYQYNLVWGSNFLPNPTGDNVSFYNQFEALEDDLIAAVGTYFNQSGINYKVEIYVNDELKLTQEGVSPYLGYHTIKLNKYIPIRKGDVFKAVVTSNSMPYILLGESRTHYTENISFSCYDGQTWEDNYDFNVTACLKVYTVEKATFSKLQEAIVNSTENHLDLYRDYEFDNETDNSTGILIDRDNFVINGNGHMINATNLSRIFNITANNVTLNDLILTGGNADKGGAIYATGSLILNNVTFIDNYAKTEGGAVGLYSNETITCNNSRFIDNYAEAGSAIYIKKGELNLYNAEISSKIFNKYSQIAALTNSTLYIENCTFANTTSSYSPALYVRGSKTSITNSKFINLNSNITAGAIGIRLGGEVYIENCEFINTTSSKNAGAIYADIAGDGNKGNVTLLNSIFEDTSSDFGGAFLQLGGDLIINNTEFINGHATYNGGSVYLSSVNGEINNCTFDSNTVDIIEGYSTYGGAILLDIGNYNISGSKFFNNNASEGAAIYAYDSAYTISNSIFENNTNPIYTVFDKQSNITETNMFINDNNISTNNTFYATIMIGEGMQLNLTNNTTNVTTLPARYDSRDYGWISSVKYQGWMGSCWTFGMIGALESALLKNADLKIDLSENNMQDTMIKYSIYGDMELTEGGLNTVAASYLLSWFGAFSENLDSYDEMGKISPVITTTQDIHVQDVIFIANDEIPNGTKLKEAIMKYGSINVNYYGQSQYDEVSLYYNTETYAQYVDVPTKQNHAVTVVGWDDNFPKEKFLATPPGDGAWIIKNSWNSDWGENGYLYVSYYDKSFVQCAPDELNGHATAIILENTIPFNKNYQYVVAWDGSFLAGSETVSYMNVFESLDDDLIAAVGTFFQEGNDNYTVEIYVNDELKLTQDGVTPYTGYHTIKLNEYIPVKKGDVFKAVITTKNIPFMKLENMRVHYTENLSFVSIDGAPWMDSYTEGVIAALKVYTVADDSEIIDNKDITVDYGSGSYFTVQVVTADGHNVGAGAAVNFTINQKTTTTTTDENGIAKVEITEVPGTYEITTTYNNQTYTNNITVKLNPDTCKVIDNKDMTVNYNNETYFTVKVVSEDEKVNAINAPVTFTINGKTTTTFTDEDGIAKIKITEKPGTYTIKTTYNNNTYTNTITVTTNDNNTPDKKHKHDNTPKQHNSKPTYTKQATHNTQPTYTLYRASDMKIICHTNNINLKALMDLFNLNLTNGHLKVYIDGTLIFDGNVTDDLTKTIFEIIEKYLGKHEITIEFTDNNGNTQKHNETIIIK